MKESPCKTCLVFPCCTTLCEEKIIFTSERIVRFAKFYNTESTHILSHKIISKCIEDLLKENKKITNNLDDRTQLLDLIRSIFEAAKEKIKQEILIEGPAKNESFCNDLIKIFVGEKST
jgi:hydroxymethylpyrimidine/phosphomethylpyrimidine kinase